MCDRGPDREETGIDAERLDVFLETIGKGNGPFLDALEEKARRENVPIVRRQTQELLRVLVTAKKPVRILEIGTAVGFSALLMAAAAPEGCRITTIEIMEERAREAEENIAACGMRDRIEVICGDARSVLEDLEDSFDFIFMDAAKGQYVRFLPEVMRLLRPGGMLVSDNCLREGSVLESRYAVDRRDRTIHKRMREYLRALGQDPALETVILSGADGVAVSVRKEEA